MNLLIDTASWAILVLGGALCLTLCAWLSVVAVGGGIR